MIMEIQETFVRKTDDENRNNNNNSEMKDRKVSWENIQRVDSLNLEAGRLSFSKSTNGHYSAVNWKLTFSLAFQSIGVIYGDIGTSPLYVYASTFRDGIGDKNDLLGVLSLIIYTMLLIPMLKYVLIVLLANDNGDGGTFALYSLICRYAKVSLIPNQQAEDAQLSNYSFDMPTNQLIRAQNIKQKLENSNAAKILLFLVTILGTSMVIGDGVLTPCISVLSAVSGIKSLGKEGEVGIAVAILILIFYVQRFGTDKVGYAFAPVIFLWFVFISGIGLYNLFKYDVGVLRAFNPKYIIDYLQRNGKKGWISLGGIVLCITGTEAMFADLGHFSVRAVQISFSGIVFPALLAAYCGQAAYLTKFPENVEDAFYASVPDPLYWPTFVVAVAAAVIASQAMISGTFAIISQSQSLSCFPIVKVVHTSSKYEGQVYIPEINYLLMIACVIVTISFKSTEKIGNAYGIAVVAGMIITTCMVTLIMLIIWKTSIWWIGLFFVVFMSIELLYFSSVLYKFMQGGFLPLAFSAVIMIIMGTWHYVHKQRYMYELTNKVSTNFVKDLAQNPNITRLPGVGLLYSELVQGIPPVFRKFIKSIPSIHSVLVFVSIKSIPISKVAMEERFLFRQVDPRGYHMFRCVVRYGYNDAIEEPKVFEMLLLENLKEFIRHDNFVLEAGVPGEILEEPLAAGEINLSVAHVEGSLAQVEQINSSPVSSGSIQAANSSNGTISGTVQGAQEEIEFIQKAMHSGMVYLLGETEVRANNKSSFLKKLVVNNVYSFLRNNFRQRENVMAIKRSRLLRVGITYEI